MSINNDADTRETVASRIGELEPLVAEYHALVAGRLQQLLPLVTEYRDLRRLAFELGIETPAPLPGDDRAIPNDRGPSSQATRGQLTAKVPSTPEERRLAGRNVAREIVRLTAATPGVTVADLANKLAVNPSGLYRTVRKLVDDGTLVKRGRQLHPGRPRS